MDDSNNHGTADTSEGTTTPQERVRAFQLDMLQVDIDFAVLWVETMEALVELHLDHEPFTEQRMTALKEWERKRKLAQVRLRSKYDPKRRRADLIDATTREGRQQMQYNLGARIGDMKAAGIKAPDWKKSKGRKIEEQMARNAKAEIAAEQALPPAPIVPPTPAESAALYIDLVAKQSGIADVLTVSNATIHAGLRRRGASPAAIRDLMKHFPNAVLVHTGQRRPLFDEV